MSSGSRLIGKTAIVTGAAQGIGYSIVECFLSQGARVLIADINVEKGSAVASALSAKGGQVTFSEVDVADAGSVEAMTVEAIRTFGPPDILVNNAGIAVFRDPLGTTPDDWRRCFSVDLDGVWNGCRSVLPYMIERRRGDIINIASVHSFKIIPHCFPYPVAKHAVVGLTRSLAIEYAAHDIRVNAIAPGYVGTEIVENIFAEAEDPAELRAQTNALHPVGRIGYPAEIGWTATFLASDEARFLTGQCIVVDGGRSILFHE
jgi:NAD(P)-dependent dehydrogenase (short-subunit alcohol dehydrogenase family)